MADLIDRQAAIDVLGVFTQADALGHTPKQIVEALPSAQRTGRWIVVDEQEPRRYGCSECKRLVWHIENYCPNCGCAMKGEEE